MTVDPGHSGRLDVAIKKLERAMALLDQRLVHRLAEAGAQAGGLFDQDRSQLATELDAARARERQLEEAGAQAAAALERAMADVRRALGEAET